MLHVWYMSRTIHGAYSCENGVPLTFPIFSLRVYHFPRFLPFNMAIFKSRRTKAFDEMIPLEFDLSQVGSAPSAVKREILERNGGFGTIIEVNGGFHGKILCKRSEMVGFSNIIWDPWSLGVNVLCRFSWRSWCTNKALIFLGQTWTISWG